MLEGHVKGGGTMLNESQCACAISIAVRCVVGDNARLDGADDACTPRVLVVEVSADCGMWTALEMHLGSSKARQKNQVGTSRPTLSSQSGLAQSLLTDLTGPTLADRHPPKSTPK